MHHCDHTAVADGVGGPNACCGTNMRIVNGRKEVNASYDILRENVIGADALRRNLMVEVGGLHNLNVKTNQSLVLFSLKENAENMYTVSFSALTKR